MRSALADCFANPLAKESCGRGLFSASMSWSPETILAALVLVSQGRFTRPIPTPSVLRVTMHWGWAICRDRIAELGPPTAFRGSRHTRTQVQFGRKITSATHMSCRWLAENDRLANSVAERSSGRPAPQASRTSLLSIGILGLAPTELAFPTANGFAPLATSAASGPAEARISRFIETEAAAHGSFPARARPITAAHSPVLAVSSWAVRPSPIAHNHAVGT